MFILVDCVGTGAAGALTGVPGAAVVTTVLLLTTCGHCPHLSAPAETMRAISAFLQD